MKPFALALAMGLAAAGAMAAEPPALSLPLSCRLGQTCWLMNMPDTDPGKAAKDFQCGPRSYDGHEGTDFAVRDARVMGEGVAVLAPAAGEVKAVRDGEEDGTFLKGGNSAVTGKECGNGVLIDHGDGWQSQLCHLRKGSVTVAAGQRVEAGQQVGLVGLSGMSAFPHVHLTVRKDGTAQDPFTGQPLSAGCGQSGTPLWRVVPNQPVALYAVGFRNAVPSEAELKADAGSPPTLDRQGPLVLFGAVFGFNAGDRLTLRLTAPDGSTVVEHSRDGTKAQAWRSESVGKKPPPGGWPPGTYGGEVMLIRPGLPPQVRRARVEVR